MAKARALVRLSLGSEPLEKPEQRNEAPCDLEEKEAPEAFDVRDHAENQRSAEVEEDVRVRTLVDDLELGERVGDEDRHGAGDLDRFAHTLVVRKPLVLMLVLLLGGCGGGGDRDGKPPASPGRFDYDRNADLGFRDAGRVNRNYAIAIRRVSYTSPGGNGRVSGFLVRPRGEGSFPGVILMHGAGGDSRQMLVQGTWLAGRGAVALAIDSPFARNPNRQLPQGVPGLRAESDLIAQNVVELRRAVDVLEEEAGVDAERIGFVGFSGGARTGALLAGNEERISAYVLMSGGSAPVAEIVKAVPIEARVEVEEILNGVDPLAHIRRAEPAKLLFLNGRRDQVVPRAALNALYRAASEPKEIRWYASTHEPTVAVYRDMLAWLTTELSLQSQPVAPGVKIGP